jgi:hypothetical protein
VSPPVPVSVVSSVNVLESPKPVAFSSAHRIDTPVTKKSVIIQADILTSNKGEVFLG